MNKENYKLYLVQNDYIPQGSIVGDFKKRDDPDFVCEIIMSDQAVVDAGFSECATTMYPDKAVINVTALMLAALKHDESLAIFNLYRELGHIECGHFSADAEPNMLQEDNQEEPDIDPLLFQEMEADSFACELIGKKKSLEALRDRLKLKAQVDRDLNLNGTPMSVKAIRDIRARIKALEEK